MVTFNLDYRYVFSHYSSQCIVLQNKPYYCDEQLVFLRIALLIRLDICKTGHNIHEDVDALQKDLLIEELVVVMEQDWRVIHWREPDSRDANLGWKVAKA